MNATHTLLVAALLVGCGDDAPKNSKPEPAAAPITNRVPVPTSVRENLGITFSKAEERLVARTLRLTGHFTAPPSARLPHHTPLAGVAQVHVKPLDRVEQGQRLASISSPEMLKLRHELHLAEDAIGSAKDALKIIAAQVDEATGALEDLKSRNARLKSANAPRADLQSKAAAQTRGLRVLAAQRDARRHELTRAKHRFEAELLAFSLTVARPVSEMRKDWEAQEVVELRAAGPGVVSEVAVSSGAWVETGTMIVELRDPTAVWFSARVLNSDVARLKDGQRVALHASGPSTQSPGEALPGTLHLGASGDLVGQTVPAFVRLDGPAPAWARPGTTAFAEVTLSGGGEPEVAIPVGALVRDGLQDVFFRRDPADPNKVIRVEAERGTSDGRWVVVYRGIAPGDEVVVDGAYELKLASTAKPDIVGHFHADGTFHAGKD